MAQAVRLSGVQAAMYNYDIIILIGCLDYQAASLPRKAPRVQKAFSPASIGLKMKMIFGELNQLTPDS